MPRYYFEINDGRAYADDVGTECTDRAAARWEAMRSLPEIALSRIAGGGDEQAYSVHVRDEVGATVYRGTLSYSGVSNA